MKEDELLADGRLRKLCAESVEWMCTTCGTHAKTESEACPVCQAMDFTGSCSRCKAKGVTIGERVCRSVQQFREKGDVAFPAKREKTLKEVAYLSPPPPPRIDTVVPPRLLPSRRTPRRIHTPESAPTSLSSLDDETHTTEVMKIAVKVALYSIATGLAVVTFHAPLAYIAGKVHAISFGASLWGSISCWPGWLDSLLIWISLAALVYGLVAYYRSKKAEMLYCALIVAGLCALYVQSHLDMVGISQKTEMSPLKINLPDRTFQPTRPSLTSGSPTTNSASPTQAEQPPVNGMSALERGIVEADPGMTPDKAVPSIEQPPGGKLSVSENIVTRLEQRGQRSDLTELESSDGRKIRAKILNLTNTSVLIRRDDGSIFEIPLSRLTDLTRQHINDWRDAAKNAKLPQ